MRQRYGRTEVERLIAEAAGHAEAYSASEVLRAGEEAGLTPEQLEAAEARLAEDARRKRKLAMAVVAAGAAVGLLALVPAREPRLDLHNERAAPSTFEVLIPIARDDAPPCSAAPDVRYRASDYCLWRRVKMPGRTRMQVGLPESHDPCPQVWVRAFTDGWVSSQVFKRNARVEVEEGGRLDQEGLGAPDMFGPPDEEDGTSIPTCEGGVQ